MKENLQRHLATVLVHLHRDDAAIAHQTETIRRLEQDHRDAALARALLSGYQDIRRADEELRGTLEAQLERC